jgi:hypothetical protein
MDGPILILPALFGSVIWLVYIVVDGIRRRQQLRVMNEFHQKLLDRIGSASEFVDFFNSEAGSRFIDSLSTDRSAPKARILSSVQRGLTSLSLGIAIFILVSSRSYSREAADILTFVATLGVGVGSGLVVSSALSYLAARRMGILNDKK